MGRRGYPTEFRRRVVDLLAAGRKVADVARGANDALGTPVTLRLPHKRRSGGDPQEAEFGLEDIAEELTATIVV